MGLLCYDLAHPHLINQKPRKKELPSSTAYSTTPWTQEKVSLSERKRKCHFQVQANMLIFKGKTERTLAHITTSPDVVLAYNTNAWSTTRVWVRYLRECIPGVGIALSKTLLLFDGFAAHTKESLDQISELQYRYLVLPPHCTASAQPLGVSVNKPFKQYVRKEFYSWLHANMHEQDHASIPKELLRTWVFESWNKVSYA